MKNDETLTRLLQENEEIRIRLQEAEETVQAIRDGAVDAVVVDGPQGERIFTLTGEDRFYRRLVETMSEGGLTTTLDGRILFCNERFGNMLRRPMEDIVGHPIETFLQESCRPQMAELCALAQVKQTRRRMVFSAGDGMPVPSRVSANLLRQTDSVCICMVVMDLSELESTEEIARQLQEQKNALEENAAALRDSRYAALNLMEDAIAAREQAERAEVQIRRAAVRFEMLAETASKLLASKTPQQIIDSLCRRVMEFLDCHVFFNYLVDEDAQRLHLNASGGLTEKAAADIEWLDFGHAICGRVAQEGKRIVAENIQESCDARADLVRSFGIKAYACHPIITQEKVIGTLSFGTRSRTTFSEDNLSTMKFVSDQVAMAIERKQAEEALKTSNEELSRFNRFAVDREMRMIELKNEINALCAQAGLPPRYAMDTRDGTPVIGDNGSALLNLSEETQQ